MHYFFYQNNLKIKLFLQKKENFRALRAPPPDPKLAPLPLQISGYAFANFWPRNHKTYVAD